MTPGVDYPQFEVSSTYTHLGWHTFTVTCTWRGTEYIRKQKIFVGIFYDPTKEIEEIIQGIYDELARSGALEALPRTA